MKRDGRFTQNLFQPFAAFLFLGLISTGLSGCTKPEESEMQASPPASPPSQASEMERTRPAAPQPLAKLEIKRLESPLLVGDSSALTVSALDVNGRERNDLSVTWASENPNLVIVNPQGTVTAIAPGTTTVTVFSEGMTTSAPIEVRLPSVAKLEIQPSVVSMAKGDAQPLQAIAADLKNREIKGLPVVLNAVAVDDKGKERTDAAVLTITQPSPAKIDIRPAAAALFVGETKQLEAVTLDAKSRAQKDPATTWQTNNPSIASVSNTGLVTGRAPGSALITASVGGVTSSPVAVTVKAKESSSLKLLKDELKTQLKGRDPSELLYLSGITGEMAGTGDPTKFAGEAEQAGLSQHPLALELADLPKDRYGLIDWATAIKTEKVKPRYSIDPKAGPDEAPFQLDVVVFTKSQFMPDVIFPHHVHTLWLTCTNCHPAIFPMNAKEANRIMTMPKIASGEFCGRCHNRVAFPLSDCLRCHVKPKEMPPVDPDYQAQNKARTP